MGAASGQVSEESGRGQSEANLLNELEIAVPRWSQPYVSQFYGANDTIKALHNQKTAKMCDAWPLGDGGEDSRATSRFVSLSPNINSAGGPCRR